MRVMANSLALFIKSRRKELLLSQRQLHQKLDWPVKNAQYISNVERGRCQFPSKDVNKLSIALQIPRDVIIDKLVQDFKYSLLNEVNK